MPAVTPSFVFEFERDMRAITENEYARLVQNLWWQSTTRVRPSQSKAERIAWLLSTAQIKSAGLGGNINFDDLVSATVEYVNEVANAGLRLRKDQLADLDGTGLELAGKWSSDIGAYMAYWPQRKVSEAILFGQNAQALGYDGVSFFNTAHPLNPYATGAGTFANLFTGAAASGSANNPGALPIDDSVDVNTAFTNLGKAVAGIAAIKMPNGEDPRFLKPRALICPPRMVPRVQQITNAKFIAQAVGSAGGSGDVEAVVRNWGWATPIEAQEFASSTSYTLSSGVAGLGAGTTVTGSDTDWYIACEEVSSTQLGALVYVDREPFKITYYTGEGGGTGVDAILDRARELEWHCQGRNIVGYGHPYALFKIRAS